MSRMAREEWASQLSEFAKRNAGRSTILEIQQPTTGIREEQAGYPLQGVSFDEDGNRITVFMGGDTPTAPHVSHVSRGPRRVEILHRRDGPDEALHIQDGSGAMFLALL